MTIKDKKVLIVLASNTETEDPAQETQFWFQELALPYYALMNDGIQVELASIDGGTVLPDLQTFLGAATQTKEVACFLEDRAAMLSLAETKPLHKLSTAHYKGIFLPGGHNTLWDFPENPYLNRLIEDFYAEKKPIAAIGHGQSALIGTEKNNGRPLVEGHKVSCFTNAEEKEIGCTDIVPFLLETKLRKLGGHFQAAATFQAHAVQDGMLITGQNPASSDMIVDLFKRSLYR